MSKQKDLSIDEKVKEMKTYRRGSYLIIIGVVALLMANLLLEHLNTGSVHARSLINEQEQVQKGYSGELTPTAYLPIVIKPRELLHIVDDFSDPNSGWDTYDSYVAGAEYLNGEYRIVSANQRSVANGSAGHELESFELSVDCRLEDEGVYFNGSGYCGITFGNSASGIHEFVIDSQQNWYLYHVPDLPYWATYDDSNYTLLASGLSSHIHSGLVGNRLKVDRQNGNVMLSVNGAMLHQGAISYSGKAFISLKSHSYLQNSFGFDARFDNYELIEK